MAFIIISKYVFILLLCLMSVSSSRIQALYRQESRAVCDTHSKLLLGSNYHLPAIPPQDILIPTSTPLLKLLLHSKNTTPSSLWQSKSLPWKITSSPTASMKLFSQSFLKSSFCQAVLHYETDCLQPTATLPHILSQHGWGGLVGFH